MILLIVNYAQLLNSDLNIINKKNIIYVMILIRGLSLSPGMKVEKTQRVLSFQVAEGSTAAQTVNLQIGFGFSLLIFDKLDYVIKRSFQSTQNTGINAGILMVAKKTFYFLLAVMQRQPEGTRCHDKLFSKGQTCLRYSTMLSPGFFTQTRLFKVKVKFVYIAHFQTLTF